MAGLTAEQRNALEARLLQAELLARRSPTKPGPGVAGTFEILGTGVRQGLQATAAFPYEAAKQSATYEAKIPTEPFPPLQPGEDPTVAQAYLANRQHRGRESQQRINAAGIAGMQRFPSAQEVSNFVTEKTGLVEVEPQAASGRIVQAAGQGIGGGAVGGPVGMFGGAIGGTAAQVAEEAGAPAWMQMALAVATPMVAGRFGRPGAQAPTTQMLRQAADQAYEAARSAGVVIPQPRMAQVVQDIADVAAREGPINRLVHPRATAALNELERIATGQQATFQQVELYRRLLRDVAASADAGERRIGTLMIEQLDDSLAEITDLASPARDYWARMRKAQTVENAVLSAYHRTAATGSGGNINNAIRQNIRAILDNPRRMRGFTAEERQLMTRVVEGSPVQNLLRLVGRLSPEGNGLMLALGIGGSMANPTLSGIAMGAGAVSRRMSDAATVRNADRLIHAIQRGGVDNGTLTPTWQQLLDAMIRAGGGAASQNPRANETKTIRSLGFRGALQ